MQTAYRTFESHAHLVGRVVEGQKEALTPVSHMVANAQVEITIDDDGNFRRADALKNEKTIIPVTVDSAGRVGKNTDAHAICDQLRYVAPYGGAQYDAYLSGLSKWAQSEYSHPKVRAVLKYIQGGTVVDDLVRAGVIELEGGEFDESADKKYGKHLIRWRVLPGVGDDSKSACWEDADLFNCYTGYYAATNADGPKDICMITGEVDIRCEKHPKGVVAMAYGAKLLSANDNSHFTFRGRFDKPQEALSVGYTASQKAHNALRWLTANEGKIIGDRTFICWNPEGKDIPSDAVFGISTEENLDYISYRKQLSETIAGYRNTLQDTDDVVIATLEAATTGRLSVTYYNELKASDFLKHIENWYSTACWNSAFWGTTTPSIQRVAKCAYGVEREKRPKVYYIDLDPKILREHVQRLMQCVVGGTPIPVDVVRALVVKASNPVAYKSTNLENLRVTACAMIRKYHNDILEREEWKLALDKNNTDRSYLFGRLLAIAENVERNTYEKGEKRETNAIKMQAVFSERPFYAWRIIFERLNPYFEKHSPGLRAYYKKNICEITDILSPNDPEWLNTRLEDIYLLGYYHQRSDLYKKKETKIEEDIENEHTGEQN